MRVVALFEQSKKNYLQRIEQYKLIVASKERQSKSWRNAFLSLKKERVPPRRKFWENPWFWTTVVSVAVISVAVGVALDAKFRKTSADLRVSSSGLGIGSLVRLQNKVTQRRTQGRIFAVVVEN